MLLDAYDELLAAICVWREARGEEYDAKLAVARVLRRRASDSRWPDELGEVVLQPYQFSSFSPRDPNAAKLPRRSGLADWQAFGECCKAVEESREPDPEFRANHYHDISIPPPAWAKKMRRVARIGRLVFYKG